MEKTQSELLREKITELSRPICEYLSANHGAYTTMIIDCNSVQILQTEQSNNEVIPWDEYEKEFN